VKHLARRFALLGLLALSAVPSRAQEASPDASAVRSLIEGQMDAFRRDDGEAAYGFAAPGIRQLFPSADAFMSMVQRSYRPVYRPKAVAFGTLKERNGALVQEVRVVGPDGQDYVAIYTLERQPDGSLKISGCYLGQVPGENA